MIEWIAMALSVLGLVFNARGSIWCWPIWTVGSSFWMFTFWTTEQWAAFTLFAIYQVLNLYGWYHWNKKKDAT